jgi:hypothetical protein
MLVLFWMVVLNKVAENLPPYWSQLCPLLAIPLLYVASRLHTNRKSEEKPKDLPSQESSNPEHGSQQGVDGGHGPPYR